MRRHAVAAVAVALFAVSSLLARDLPTIDALAGKRTDPSAQSAIATRGRDLIKAGLPLSVEARLGVPTMLWASGSTAAPFKLPQKRTDTGSAEATARGYLAQYATLYGFDPSDASSASLIFVHDLGKGPIIAKFNQHVEGIEIFREEINVMMNQRHELVAIGGYISSTNTPPARAGDLSFTLDARNAAANAYQDLTLLPFDASQLAPAGSRAGYDYYNLPASAQQVEPVRVRKVYFHLPEGLEPGYYIEVAVRDEVASVDGNTHTLDYYAYVVSAVDGRLLFRANLTVNDEAKGDKARTKQQTNVSNPFTYRVWADVGGIPFDTPAGNAVHPKVTAAPDGFQAAFVGTNDVTLSNYPFSQNDPWLAAGATETNGNNVDAYVDIASPDGFNGADFRGAVTAPGQFLHTHTPGTAVTTTEQRHGSIQQLFFNNNFLHDWYYDAGFDEVSRNAQVSNYGRGGLEVDGIKAEAQDFGSRNNANMSTPNDGARPRMQMYVFDTAAPKYVQTISPGNIAGIQSVGTGQFGAQVFDTTQIAVLPNPVTGCTAASFNDPAIPGGATGKIVVVDRQPTSGVGSCSIGTKLNNAMAATGGPPAGFILVNLQSTPDTLVIVTGSLPSFTIPFLTITWNGAQPIKNEIALANPVTLRMVREAGSDRDGTIDNQIVFHEWGHYISNRLIGNANGLVSNQSRGMGEGWGDFSAMMLTVRSDDPSTPSNATWNGAYALATYATSGGADGGLNQGYYYGIRRMPYSTDLTRNSLTYKHIANGQAISGAPISFGASGSNNAEVHNTGEVWTTMLWECYAALLRDTQGGSPRLTFTEAQTRMKSYLVASMKMTPSVNPTFVEARDAVLAAAYATDSTDYVEFWQAFAKRGLGVGATAVANRDSTDNTGITESFVATPELIFDHALLDDSGGSCDADGALDAGEGGHLTIYLKNTGTTTLTGVTGTVSASTSGFAVLGGGSLNFPSVDPLSTTSVTVAVTADGTVSGITQADFALQFTHPSLANIPRNATLSFRTNTDVQVANTNTDSVESPTTLWTTDFNVALTGISLGAFSRKATTPLQHVWFGPDLGTNSDERLISPVFTATGGVPATIQFDHSFGFEFDAFGNYDGGIVEASINGGAFANIGGAAGVLPNYNGTLLVYSGNTNPIQGQAAFTKDSGGTIHTTFNTASLSAGDTVQFRFRLGSDPSFGAAGWTIDNIQVTGVTTTPFDTVVTDTPCNLPTVTSLLSGTNPSTFGQSVTFTANVTSGGGTPTGNVDFKEGAATLATVPLAGGSAQFITSLLSVGAHNIVAVYAGAPGFLSSSSGVVTQTVNKAATTTVLNTVSPNPALVGASLSYTATVSSVVGTPGGSVQFFDGVTLLGTVGLAGGQATFNTSSLSSGTHSITATYGGNGTYASSTSSPAYSQVVTLPVLSFAATSPLRVLESAPSVTITVNRTGLLSGSSSVHYATSNGSADGGDFNSTSGDLNYAPTDAAQSFNITLLNDPATEGVQSFTVTLSAETGATLGSTTLTVEIIDDESNYGDANLDGTADVIWRNTSNGVDTLWRMNASGVASQAALFTFNSATWKVVASGDFDGDGRVDLFWRQDGTGNDYVWLINDNNVVSILQPSVTDNDWKVVGAGDVNGDGRADIIWRHATNGAVYVWFMNNGLVQNAVGLPTVSDLGWVVVGTGDFNGDLKTDLFWRHSVTGANYIWFLDNTSVNAVPTAFVGDLQWKVVATGDFNGDGKDDLYWHHDTGTNYIWIMNGAAPNASLQPNFPGGSTTNAVGAGDFDADGDDDLLIREAATNANEAWLMNGTAHTVVALPTFGSATENPVSPK